jgi:hypothetical protein
MLFLTRKVLFSISAVFLIVAMDNTQGLDPGLNNATRGDYGLSSGAPAADCGASMAMRAAAVEGMPAWQYRRHQARSERSDDALPDAGAFERTP